ncbi:MAG: outer membrane lipoprotein carrier protein LolA [Flavobacteriaceae bacterium]|jgi:outer membrane lipoprotein-sorting protein|nr:outer membrane lipoprotein carrier protein LolA [Flavobacteriaceae bacterium]
MKKQINVLLILLISSITLAQEQQRAEALLDEVSENLAQFNNIAITFTYELVNRKELIQQKEKGSLIVEGDAYLLKLMGIEQLSDGINKHTINADNEEVLIEPLSNGFDEGLSPSKIFSFYNQGYRFEWDILQPLYGGRKIQYIKLIPIDTYAQASYLLLGIDTKTKNIYKLIEVGNDGTETTLTIGSFKTNIEIPTNTFVFSASDYPNYYIDRF